MSKQNSLLHHRFVLFRFSVDWMQPACTGEGSLLYPVYPFTPELFQKQPHRHTQKQRLARHLGTSGPGQADRQNYTSHSYSQVTPRVHGRQGLLGSG